MTGGGHTAAYLLDGDGQRVSQTIDSVTTLLDRDPRGELSSVLVAGDEAYLPGMASLGSSDGVDWTATLADAQGSVLATVDTAGVMGPIARDDPYGGPRPSSTLPVGIGYTGEWTDPTGLVDLRARVYDPSLQRFLTRDAFGGIGTIPATGKQVVHVVTCTQGPSGVAQDAEPSTNGAGRWSSRIRPSVTQVVYRPLVDHPARR